MKTPAMMVAVLGMVTACAESPASSSAEWDGPTYEMELTANEPGVIHVTARLPQTPTRLQMSGNGAGQLSDGWATFVTDLSLTDEAGSPIRVERDGRNAWRVGEGPTGAVRLGYSIDLAHDTVDWPGGVDGAALQLPWGAFFSGRAVFVVPEHATGPTRVAFRTSAGWDVAAPWSPVPGQAGVYEAPSPTSLTESYTFVGDHEAFTVERNGVELAFALGGPSVVSRAAEFRSMAESVFEYYDATMGGPPRPAPGESFGRVLTIINEADITDGEVIGSHINILLEPDPDPMGQLFANFGFTHELFHLWNGKSIRSNGSEDWFSEGFTNYYALKALHEAGMLDEPSFLGVLGGIFYPRYVGDEGYGVLSMREAVEIDKDGHWGLIYAGGLFTAICQDVEIRTSTANRRSIDDVMRAMYERYAGSSDEFGAADVEQTIAGLSEHDPAAFFERHVIGAEPIPIAACLSRIGLDAKAVDGQLQITRPENLEADRAAMLAGMLGGR